MSVDESKILEELERDIENNLEEEIKEEIYHLALKLHRLYQHQKQRSSNQSDQKSTRNKKILSEVNINIKLEGGTTIQINEIKKEARGNGHRPAHVAKRAQIVQRKTVKPTPRAVKFNWAQSLRSRRSSEARIVNPESRDKTQDKRVGCGNNQECITTGGGWKY